MLYVIDGWCLLAVGLAFALWGPVIIPWFGIVETRAEVRSLPSVFWPSAGLSRLLGAALTACGLAALGVSQSREPRLQRAAFSYFWYGHLAMCITCALQQFATFNGPGGFVLLDVLLFLWGLYSYYWVSETSVPRKVVRNTDELRSEWEREIREAAGQQERNRLAQELHDSIKQQLYAIQTDLAAAQVRLQDIPRESLDPIEHARASARQAMAEMNAMLDQLRASPLETVGLVEALRRQCEALGYRTGADVVTEFGALPPNDQLPAGAHTEAFRVAQEALSNAARHARASHVKLELKVTGDTFTLRIHDDGQGFTPAGATRGMGLRNMQTRADAMGGTLSIESAPEAGCVVTLCLPLAAGKPIELRRHIRLAMAALVLALLPLWSAYTQSSGRPYYLALATIPVAATLYHLAQSLRWKYAPRRHVWPA